MLVVKVCSVCKRSCCVQGLFMCDESKTADVIEIPLSVLYKKQLEHPSYFAPFSYEKQEE